MTTHGTRMTRMLVLVVDGVAGGPPKVPRRAQYDKLMRGRGQEVALLCEAQAHPLPMFRPSPNTEGFLVLVVSCDRMRHLHTTQRLVLSNLTSAEPVSSEAPKVSEYAKSPTFLRASGSSFTLLCPAQGFPVPQFSERFDVSETGVGEPSTLTCKAQAHPTPEYSPISKGLLTAASGVRLLQGRLQRGTIQHHAKFCSLLEPFSSQAPKASGARGDILTKERRSAFAITCKVQAFPLPEFRNQSIYNQISRFDSLNATPWHSLALDPLSSESPKVSGEQGVAMVRQEGAGFSMLCPAQGFPVPSFRSVCALVCPMRTEPYSSEAPKVSGAHGEIIIRRAKTGFALPCRAQGHPVPEFRSELSPFSSEAPKVAEGEKFDNLMRASGSSFALPCKGQGFPVPEFRYVVEPKRYHEAAEAKATVPLCFVHAPPSPSPFRLHRRYILLFEAPKVSEVERIVNLMRASGSSFALPCKGQGFPVPEFSGAPKTEGEKIDTFKRARGSSFALTCKAQGFPVPEFRAPCEERKNVIINLTFSGSEPISSGSPKVAEGEKIETLTRGVGSSFALLCKAQGFPIPKFRSVLPSVRRGPKSRSRASPPGWPRRHGVTSSSSRRTLLSPFPARLRASPCRNLEPFSSESPKLAGSRSDTFYRRRGSSFAIPCRVQGFPVPEFRAPKYVQIPKLKKRQKLIKLCAPSEPFSSESPKVAEGARGDIYIRHQGSSFALTCKVQGFPVPEYRWVCREGDVKHYSIVGTATHPKTKSSSRLLQHSGLRHPSPTALSSEAPRVAPGGRGFIMVQRAGAGFGLTCPVQAFPLPEFRWFKVSEGGRKAAVELGDRVKQVGGTLIIREAKVEDSGKYLCVVNNSVGGESVETVLTVTAPLSAQVEPKVQTVEFGRPATFTCTYRGNPVKSVTWLKDGIPLNHKEAVLRIDTVGREDKGMYQCFVRNDQESAQGTAELKLGGRFEPPQLIYTFQTNTLQPGPAVFLKCVAAGNPTPEITWELDGTRLANSERMQVGQYVTVNGEVVSHLNISAVHTNDGGLYACVASSTVGSVRHAARLNVYGLPYIRPMDKAAVVAGENMVVHCPVAGYPIDSIVWEKNGRMLPINRRQKTFPNGTLIVEAVQRSTDQGRYTCVARNSQAYTARGDLDVQVMEPPQIHPLVVAGTPVIGKELLIPCYVVGGDSPLDMVWQKDGQPISPARLDSNPPDPWHSPGDRRERSQTLEESCELLSSARNESELGGGDELNMFSANIGLDPHLAVHQRGDRYLVLRFSALCPHHSGNYTCEASNMAGTVGYTVPLDVLVPPRWIVEPADKAFALGSDARLECKADGFPRPTLGWKKAAGHTPGDYRDLDVNNPNIKVTDDGTLHISSIQKSHEGYYLCEANNGIGAGLSTVIYVRVQAPPQFKIQYRNQTARHGDDAVLECEAGGETPIGILWSKDKHSVDQAAEPRYTIREEMRGGSVHSSLSIKTTDRTDSAVYTCVATNAFGSADTNINLIIQERPEQPSSLKVLDKSGRSVELSWTSPYDGNSPITRYIVEYKLSRRNWENDGERMMVPGNQNMAAVLDLRPATTYHLRIVARNEIGDSDPSDIVTIITAEEAPSGAPRDLKVEAVDQNSLRVKWKPPLREEWNGDIQGYQVGYRLASSNTSYVYETVEFSKEVGKEHQLTIKKLQVYTEYAVVVSAFNKIGQGPTTEEIRSYTAEGTPQQPPHDVTCTTLTSQTIRVSWASPPLETVQGVIKGYKVIYGPSDKWYDEERKDTKITSSTETHLHGLQKYTNYSLQVLAFTSGGEGVRSQPIHCQTDQDVPDAPTSVKALVMSADSILVSWLPPDRPNGIITQYTVYFKEEGKSDSEAEQEKLLSSQLNYEANGLKQRDEYVFWVTASTTIGEGEKSESVHLKLSSKVPAKIASFDDEYVATYKEDVKLHCQAVGLPTPDIRWTIRGEPFTPNDRMRLLTEGSLLIREVSRDDAGEYTCHVENPYGQDTVTHTLLIQAPPHPPEIQLQSTTTNSIEVKLKPSVIDDTTPIHGYTVYYKPEFSTWESVQVPASTRSYLLEGLWCGSRYQIYASAYNKIGTGESSEILNTRTKGKKPEIPEVHRFVEVSSVSINLHLKAWQDGGCPMNYFVVEYKPRHQTEWIMADNQVSPTGNYGIMELTPATWYNLRISAHNNAGSSVAEYEVATLTLTGGTIAPAREVPAFGAGDLPIYLNLNLIVPVVSAVVVIVLAIVIICYLRGRNTPIKATLPPTVSDSRVTWLPDWWPKWLDLNVLVPVIATIVVIIVGIVVICVAVTRRKNGIENLRLRVEFTSTSPFTVTMVK
ncbi:down syndrome cell adhesion molecule [Penaeus vannamei]|uniref:Down syndrome cell adhesion molecule n=1 Tax=Penaeus vannamei TaxID=6689 RepID=A0A423U600_PENVA|nr:down syndrome cell adhesion molecule [Penaeus vannamei]